MRGFSSSRVEGKQFASLLLGKTELDLEGLGHFWGRGTGEPQLDLDAVVDEPLQGGESTDHDDPGTETGPHAGEAKIPGGAAEGGALSIVGGSVMEATRCDFTNNRASRGGAAFIDGGAAGTHEPGHALCATMTRDAPDGADTDSLLACCANLGGTPACAARHGVHKSTKVRNCVVLPSHNWLYFVFLTA